MKRAPHPTDATARRQPRALVAILVLAFGLRLAAVLWLSDTVPFSDYRFYQLAAEKIVEDPGFFFDSAEVQYYGRFGWWPPLYPFSIGALYTVAGIDHRLVVFLQVLLGTFVCWLVYRLGLRCGGGERLGLVAALLAAVNPTYIFATNLLASENLFVVWMLLGLLWSTRTPGSRTTRIVGGVLLGLGALTRAIGLLVPFVVAAWMFARAETRRVALHHAATLLLACFATIAPWTLRNAIVVGSPAIVCFGGGLNFYFGHNEVGIGYRDLASTPMSQLTTQDAIDDAGYALGLRYIADHPWAVIRNAGPKVVALFGSPGYATHSNSAIMLPDGWRTDPVKSQIAAALRAKQREKNRLLDGLFTRLAEAHSYLVLAGALAAVALLRRRLTPELWLLVALSLAWIGAHVVFWAQPRFRYPMELFLMVLAAALTLRASPRAALACVFVAAFAGCTSPSTRHDLPPVEPWGDLAHPYGDVIDEAARAALGPREARYSVRYREVWLEDFYALDMNVRQARERQARALRERAITLKRVGNVDSLGLYLEALHTAPVDIPSYQEAGRILLARGVPRRAHPILAQGIRLDPKNRVLWMLLGTAYEQLGDAEKARLSFEYAAQLSDGNSQ